MAGNSEESYDRGIQSSDDSHHFERLHVEPIYDSFICPLTKQVMQDPVSLENGQTFEREAIEKWLRDRSKNGHKPICPVTLRELRTAELNPSIGLRNTIGEWNARNEAAKVDLARRSLSLSSAEDDIVRALKYVDHLCLKNPSKRHVIHQEGLVPGVADVLKSTSRRVRCKALETLRIVVEDDSDNKEILAEGDTVRTIVKFLSHEPSREREEAVSLLYELSKSELLCDKIGSVYGAIIILVGMASSNSEDLFTVEKADKTLDNLAQCENNVRQMAEYGRLQPLLTLLLEGSPETKVAMASFLGELALNNDMKVLVAKIAGPSLIVLMKSGDMQSREASLKALNQISSDETSAKILIELGILPPLVKNLFTTGTNLFPMRLKEICATILSNIVNSGHDFDSLPVGPNNQTLVSNDVIHNLLQLISNTGPSIECKLLQVLVGLTNSPSTVLSVVSAIKSFGAMISLVQFIEAPQRELRLTALKLLHNLSPHMGSELASCLRGTLGQLSSLIHIVSEDIGITEDQVAAVGLLANLPERDTSLTKQMINEEAFPSFVSRIVRIRQGTMRGTRFMTPYQEGLVKVLSRITFALPEEPALALCRELNLAALFIELLQANGLDNVQMVSAVALENLSLQSKNLTKLPEFPSPGICATIFPCLSQPHVIRGLCKIHGGTCSLRETFCLLEGQAVDKLVSLLDHSNEKVMEASLAALSSLIEDGVNVEEGVKTLIEGEGAKLIFDILLERRTEILRRRSVWVVERLLRNEDVAYDVASNPNISTALVDAFQYGDAQTRQVAERALRHVDRIPNFSGIYPNA